MTFLHDKHLYRYGISIFQNIIKEEWLYWTKTSRETMLFHRMGQKIKINQRSFSEAKDFIKKDKDLFHIEKTRETVPFISVLSQFNGSKSRKVVDWFKKINIISGINEFVFKDYTIDLFEKNNEFKSWALKILAALQIEDIQIIEVDQKFPIDPTINTSDEDLKNAVDALKKIVKKNKFKEKKVDVIKKISDDDKTYSMPISFESEGTRKLIYLLGPLFDTIKSEKLLLIDEFDNKFHSLLSKYIIDQCQQKNSPNSQLIITCHDTNLLTKELFRRDQIWFVEKNPKHESELYSLLEYKEHYTRKGNSYSKDYLTGKYGAIPLFKSFENLKEMIDG